MRKASLSLAIIALIAVPAAHAQDASAPTDKGPTDPGLTEKGQTDPNTTVTVKGKKKPVRKTLDKTIYDVSNSPKAANGTAQDVLQATPGVSVTADGQISVKGNPQVTVLINGKPSAVMSGPDRAVALQTMAGSDIASVEVITNPSAAYNANGGAILNIVLKKDHKPGARGLIKGSVSDQGLWNVAASGDATKGHISVHASAAFRRDGTLKFRGSDSAWNNPLNGASGDNRQSSKVFVRRIVESASFGIDDDLNDTDSLSLQTRYNFRRSHPWFDELNDNISEGARSLYHRVSYGPNQQSDDSASLSYSHQNGDNALRMDIRHSDTIALIDKSYRNLYLTPAQATEYGHGLSKSARHLSEASLDWSRPSPFGLIGAGLDAQYEVNDLDNYQASIDPVTQVETPDANTTNRYRATTTQGAVYLTDQIRRGKWEWLLGARYEAASTRLTPAQAHNATWQGLNPSLHVKYSFSDVTSLSFSLRRSLQRPDPRDLNPFTTYLDAQNLQRGNPDLKPQVLTSYELSLDSDKDQLSHSFGAFYRLSRDTVTDTHSIIDDDVLLTSTQNGGTGLSAGISGSLDWRPNSTWHVSTDGSVYRVRLLTPDLYGRVRQEAGSAYINLSLGYSRGRDDISLDAHAESGGIVPLGRYGGSNSLNIAWKRRMTKRLTLTLNANDILDGSKARFRTDAATFHQSGFNHFVARRLYIGFVEKLGGK